MGVDESLGFGLAFDEVVVVESPGIGGLIFDEAVVVESP